MSLMITAPLPIHTEGSVLWLFKWSQGSQLSQWADVIDTPCIFRLRDPIAPAGYTALLYR